MKKIIALVMAMVMVAALAACGAQPAAPAAPATTAAPAETEAPTEAEKATVNETIAEAKSAEVEEVIIGQNSVASLNAFGTKANCPGMYEVYEMLYECDVKGDMYPILADKTYEGSFMPGCDHEKGSDTYTVKIYDYIKDHKGNPVTADDVAFSFMHSLNEENTSGWKDNLLEVTAKDPTTVEFKFAAEQDKVGQLLNIFCRCIIVSEKAYTESTSNLNEEMIGTGHYKFVSFTAGSELKLEKNEDYWQTREELIAPEQQANVKKLTYTFIDEAAQKVIGLKTDALNMVAGFGGKDAADFIDGGEYADKFNVYAYSNKMVNFIAPNCSPESPCGDVNLRQAIFYSIDRDGFITAMGEGFAKLPAFASAYYTDYDFVDWESMDNYNTSKGVDPAKVKEYLDKSSYNGETLKIMFNQGDDDKVQVLISMLAAQGINAEGLPVDRAAADATQSDPTAWDLTYGMMAGDYNVTVWQHAFDYGNVAEGGRTMYHTVDDEWQKMLDTCLTEAGHTPENMKAWWEHATENAYVMALSYDTKYDILPKNCVSYVLGDKLTALMGASIYE